MRLLLDKISPNSRGRQTDDGNSKFHVLLEELKSTPKYQSYEVCVVCLYMIHHNVGIRRKDLVDDDI
jgi:hypothetical protein